MLIQTSSGIIEIEISEIESITFTEPVSIDEIEMFTKIIPVINMLNSPNPFNPSTIISFELLNDVPENVELRVYNQKGQFVKEIVKDKLAKGKYSYIWNGKNAKNRCVSSGVYFYQLTIAGKNMTKKMILLK